MPQAAPGWYADPYDPSRERVWDGSAWTSETRIPPAKASSSPGPTAWGTPPDTWTTQAPTWSPPSMPQPEHTALYPASTTNWRRIGLIVGAIVLPVIGFAAGYAAHQSDDARQPAASFGPTPTTGSEPANVNVPGPTAPPGVDTAGAVAEQNLGMAANTVTAFLRARPGVAITPQQLENFNARFAFDNPGAPIGGPGALGGPAVISTGVDHLPGAPRRVVLALPGNSACYYVSVTEGRANQYGVAHGADAVSHCFVSEMAGGVPQVRPETKWSNRWPPPTT